MKHWGSICLICLMLGACASDKKVAPTEGRLSLNDPVTISKSAEKQTLSAPEKSATFLINGSNAQNKHRHLLIEKSDQSWNVKAGNIHTTEVPILSSVLVGNKNVYVLDTNFNLFVYDKKGNKQIEKQLKQNEIGIALTSKNDTFYALSQNGTLVAMDKTGKNLWTKELNNPFRSSPVIYKDIIYLMSANNNLWALDTKNGKEIWHYKTTTPLTTIWAMGRPGINNNIIVVPFSNGLVTAFNSQNGTFLWETDLVGKKSFNQVERITQMLASPVIEDNVVYLAGNAHSFKAIDLKSGDKIWTNQLASSTTPIVNGNTLFVLDNDKILYALNKKDGKQFWNTPLSLTNEKAFLALINNQVIVMTKNQVVMVEAQSGKIKSDTMGTTKVSVPVFTQAGLYFLSDNDKLYYQGTIK